jgi:hypothetical protein
MLGSSFAPRHCAGCISDFYHIAGGLEQNLWLRNPASPAPRADLPLVQRRIRLIPLSLPGLTRQSTLEPTPALRVDARIKSGHDKQGCVPFASLH